MLIKALLCGELTKWTDYFFFFQLHSCIVAILSVFSCTHKKITQNEEKKELFTIFNYLHFYWKLRLYSLFSLFLPNEWGRNQKTEKYLRLSPSNQHDFSLMLGHIHTMPAALLLTFIGLSCEGGRGNCEKHEWRQESRDYFQLKRSSKYKIACKVIGRWTWGSLFLEERDQQEKFRKNFFFSCGGGGGGRWEIWSIILRVGICGRVHELIRRLFWHLCVYETVLVEHEVIFTVIGVQCSVWRRKQSICV